MADACRLVLPEPSLLRSPGGPGVPSSPRDTPLSQGGSSERLVDDPHGRRSRLRHLGFRPLFAAGAVRANHRLSRPHGSGIPRWDVTAPSQEENRASSPRPRHPASGRHRPFHRVRIRRCAGRPAGVGSALRNGHRGAGRPQRNGWRRADHGEPHRVRRTDDHQRRPTRTARGADPQRARLLVPGAARGGRQGSRCHQHVAAGGGRGQPGAGVPHLLIPRHGGCGRPRCLPSVPPSLRVRRSFLPAPGKSANRYETEAAPSPAIVRAGSGEGPRGHLCPLPSRPAWADTFRDRASGGPGRLLRRRSGRPRRSASSPPKFRWPPAALPSHCRSRCPYRSVARDHAADACRHHRTAFGPETAGAPSIPPVDRPLPHSRTHALTHSHTPTPAAPPR